MGDFGKGLKNLNQTTKNIMEVSDAAQATKQFVDNIQAASESVSSMAESYGQSAEQLGSSVGNLVGAYNDSAEAVNEKSIDIVDTLKKEVLALKTNKIKNDLNLLYKIQIGTFLRSMLNNKQFTDLNAEEEKINGTFKYFVDAGNSKKEADRLKINLRNLGFKGAFIVAFLDGKQISTKEALNLQNKLKENE